MTEEHVAELDWLPEMRRHEEAVKQSEGDGLRARWAFGHCMLKMRRGKKRLRNNMLTVLEDKLGVPRSELTARMKFAEKCPTEEELTTVVSKSWHDIRQNCLTDNPRRKKAEASAEASADDRHLNTGDRLATSHRLITDIDRKELAEEHVPMITEIEDALKSLKNDIAQRESA